MVGLVDLVLIGIGVYIIKLPINLIYKGWNSYKVESIKLRSEEGDFYEISEKPKRRYGLIIADAPKLRLKKGFANAAELAYKTFLSLGYNKKDIYILEGRKRPKNRFDTNNFLCNKKNLVSVLNHLSKEINSEDEFFMSVFAHGKPLIDLPLINLGPTTIYLSNKSSDVISEKKLEEMLSDLKPKYSVLFFNSCFGGGFAKRLGKGGTIAISVSRPDKTACTNMPYDIEQKYGCQGSKFTLAFFSALKGSFPDGTPITLPRRNLESIFDYAARFEKEEQEDLLDVFLKKFGKRIERHFGEEGLLVAKQFWKRFDTYINIEPLGTNTPHLVYGKIDPAQLIL